MIGFNLSEATQEPWMQSNISHLPLEKQRELEQITEMIKAQEDVEMVILFGSYARGD